MHGKTHRKAYFYAFTKDGAGETKKDQHINDKTPENSKQTDAAHTRPHSKQENKPFTRKKIETTSQ